ncbi:MAG: hypothetical protein PVF34_04620 [Gammaproteobacteria bacterium]
MVTNSLLAFVVLSAGGCGDDKTVAGSCKTNELADNSVLCIDYYDGGKTSQWRQACNDMMQGQWSSSACDSASALGGCGAGNKVIWYYPSAKHQAVEQVEQACLSKSRKFISGVAGEPVIESK